MRFETERLIIRKPVLDDAKDIFKNYTQCSEVTKYLIWEPHKTLSDTEEWIKYCINIWDENKVLPFIIYSKELNEAIGMIDFTITDFRINFGYVLAKAFWNQGIMTEAGKLIIDELLQRDEIYRIEALHDIDNPASGRVMEKLGMEFEGIVRKYSLHPNISNIPRDCKMYSIVKS